MVITPKLNLVKIYEPREFNITKRNSLDEIPLYFCNLSPLFTTRVQC